MARTVLQIIAPQLLPIGAAAVYVVPTNRTTVISRISFTNVSATDRYVNLWLVPSGGVPDDSNQIVKELFVPADETISPIDVEGQAIPAATSIYANAEVISAINIIGSGTEITN